MAFAELLETYAERFTNRGELLLKPGEALEGAVSAAGVPHAPGVYLVYGRAGDGERLLYVDKAGTLRSDGSFTSQMLDDRMTAKQYGKARTTLWPRWIEQMELEALVIRWFVTFEGEPRVLPAKAESDLLQAWFDDHGCLPPENREM